METIRSFVHRDNVFKAFYYHGNGGGVEIRGLLRFMNPHGSGKPDSKYDLCSRGIIIQVSESTWLYVPFYSYVFQNPRSHTWLALPQEDFKLLHKEIE